MKKGIVKTVKIDSEALKKSIKEAGYSLRSLAPEIGVDRRTIMLWLKKGEMPEYLLKVIDDKVRPKDKTIWMRLGVMVKVTDDELFDMMEQAHMYRVEVDGFPTQHESMADYDLSEGEAECFLRRAIAEGESYIPECCFDGYINWYLEERKRRRA